MTPAVIDTHLLLKVLYTSLIAGVGVSVVFAFAVLGVVRSNDARREQRPTAAATYALIGAVGLALTAGLIVYGLILLARKS
jgi:predicted membrane channel-forming protein YqfA (hemolysin III family)